MKAYFEEALKLIESKEIRDYLRTRADLFYSGWKGMYKCAEIVTHAPASIEKKIIILELIAEQVECNPNHFYYEPFNLLKEARIVLFERYNNIPPGTVFQLRIFKYNELINVYYNELFTTFDAALLEIKNHNDDYNNPDRTYFISYSLTKYIPGDDGKMNEYCLWIMNALGEIWYFEYLDTIYEPDDWADMFYCSCDLILPVPFKPGDIITVDLRPFAKIGRVLIINTGNNEDCCALQCMAVKPNGKICVTAFNHIYYFKPYKNIFLSGLYRAVCQEGKLSKHEMPLATLSDILKKTPEFANNIQNFMHERFLNKQFSNITWGELKTGLKI